MYSSSRRRSRIQALVALKFGGGERNAAFHRKGAEVFERRIVRRPFLGQWRSVGGKELRSIEEEHQFVGELGFERRQLGCRRISHRA